MEKPSSNLDAFNDDPSFKDPLEAIYALNIGDFVVESFISDDLLEKINARLGSDPDKLKRQLEELIQIYSIDKTLKILGFESGEGFVIYDSIAATLREMFQVEACHLFQTAHKETGEDTLSLTGSSLELSTHSRWDIGVQVRDGDLLSEAFSARRSQVVQRPDKNPHWHPIERLNQDKVKSLLATPLRQGEKRLGVLLFESHEEKDFSPELLSLAEATAEVFVTSIRLQQLVGEAQTQVGLPNANPSELRSLRARITESIADLGIHQQRFVECLSAAIDARHHFTRGHSLHVAQVARTVAESMNLNEKTVDLVYYAGLLGTLGKIHIPGEVLAKREDLTEREWDSLRNHPNVGVGLLAHINFLSEVVPYVHSQKERWDGTGGPEGLKGQSIPLGARILAVADAYQAMTRERPYRGAPLSHDDVLKVLQDEAGEKWDPAVVEALSKISADSLA